jgi:predicted nucleic acid-binding protein
MNNRVLIDTDILIDYFKNNINAVEYLENENRELYISAINVAELYAGIVDNEELAIIREFLTAFKIVNICIDIAECAGLLRNKYYKSHNVGLADAIIAASASSIDAVVVTLNRKHFPMFNGDQILTPYSKV